MTNHVVEPLANQNRTVAGGVAIIIAAGIACLALVAGRPTFAYQVLAALTITWMIAGSRGRLAPLYLSPLVIGAVGLLAMGVLGVTFYGGTLSAAGGSANVALSDAQTEMTQNLLVTAGLCVLAGGLATSWLLKPIAEPLVDAVVQLPPAVRKWMLAGSFVPLMLMVALSGRGLLARDEYLESEVVSRSLLGLAGQLSIAAVLALGYLVATGRGGVRFTGVILTIAYFALFFAGGSRRLAMLPALFALGLLIGKRNKATVILLVLSLPISLSLIGLALYLRGLPAHGLLPYVGSLPGFFAVPPPWDAIARNVLISFGIVGATAFQQPPIDPGVFWVSINPLPGEAAGWYGEAAGLRINAYTPYAGVGELGNYGTGYVVGYCLAVGVILGLFERQVRTLRRDGLAALGLIPVGLAGLFVLYAVQYNLRTATRMLVYGVAAAVALTVVAAVVRRRRAKDAQGPPRALRRAHTLGGHDHGRSA